MAKRLGYGTTLEIDFLTVASFQTIGQVLDINAPGLQRDDVEVTAMDSPNDTKEYIRGLIESGELAFEVNWDHNTASLNHDDLLTAMKASSSAALDAYRITLPGGSGEVITFSGYVKGYTPAIPVQDKMVLSLTVKVTGAVAIA